MSRLKTAPWRSRSRRGGSADPAPLQERIAQLEAEARRLRAIAAGDDPEPGLAGPIFVGGTGRSGASIVGHMIGRHPDIVALPSGLRFHTAGGGFRRVVSGRETPAQFTTDVAETEYSLTGAAGRATALARLATKTQLQHATQRLEELADHDVAAALRVFMHTLVDPFALGHGGRTWVDTTPQNIAAADGLLDVFPTAKMIHTVRDGRDVAASMVTMAWAPDAFDDALDLWATRLRAAHHGSRAADPDRLLVVRLEELIHLERDREFDRIVALLGIHDHEPLRRYFDTTMDSRRGHVGRWRTEVDASQTTTIDTRYRKLYDELASEGLQCLPADPDAVDKIHRDRTPADRRNA